MAILYYIIFGACYLLSLLPLRLLYCMSDLLYVLIFYVVRYRHKIVWKNLTTSFPDKSDKEIRDIEKKFYSWFCDYIVETIKMLTISKGEMRRRMVFKNVEGLTKVLHEGQSCALYLGHYCNWEWITSLPLVIKDDNIQFGHIYHPLENKKFDKFLLDLRERMGSTSISMQNILRKLVEYRKMNKSIIIGYISDQVPFWNNIHYWTDFLNHDTPVFTGAERIIKSAGHAAFYGDLKRVKRGYYECEFKLLTRKPDECGEFEITEMYFRELEKTIRRTPQYWLWTHNRWKRTRQEFDRHYIPGTGRAKA